MNAGRDERTISATCFILLSTSSTLSKNSVAPSCEGGCQAHVFARMQHITCPPTFFLRFSLSA